MQLVWNVAQGPRPDPEQDLTKGKDSFQVPVIICIREVARDLKKKSHIRGK